jgi:hypothetical protein
MVVYHFEMNLRYAEIREYTDRYYESNILQLTLTYVV